MSTPELSKEGRVKRLSTKAIASQVNSGKGDPVALAFMRMSLDSRRKAATKRAELASVARSQGRESYKVVATGTGGSKKVPWTRTDLGLPINRDMAK